ncbi:MAG: ABC transporter permease, partial [Candidatus Nitrosocosmicus sp.]
LVANIFLIWGTMSSIGFFLSSHMLHMRNATQLISFVNVILAVIPPVFYSIDRLPLPLQIISYFIPTTHASLMLQYSMGFPTPPQWSIELGLIVQIAYLIFFVVLAKKKALWREN